jgi:hypothetical protein
MQFDRFGFPINALLIGEPRASSSWLHSQSSAGRACSFSSGSAASAACAATPAGQPHQSLPGFQGSNQSEPSMSQRVDLPFELRNALRVVHGFAFVRIIRLSSYLLQIASDSCKSGICLEGAVSGASNGRRN